MGIAVTREYGWWLATPGFLWWRDTRMSRIWPSRFRSTSRSRYIHSTASITPGSIVARVSSCRVFSQFVHTLSCDLVLRHDHDTRGCSAAPHTFTADDPRGARRVELDGGSAALGERRFFVSGRAVPRRQRARERRARAR